jgi:hypothetical protein
MSVSVGERRKYYHKRNAGGLTPDKSASSGYLAPTRRTSNPTSELITFGLPVTWTNLSGAQQRKKGWRRNGKKGSTYSYMGIY